MDPKDFNNWIGMSDSRAMRDCQSNGPTAAMRQIPEACEELAKAVAGMVEAVSRMEDRIQPAMRVEPQCNQTKEAEGRQTPSAPLAATITGAAVHVAALAARINALAGRVEL
jgi:hypothetical protein